MKGKKEESSEMTLFRMGALQVWFCKKTETTSVFQEMEKCTVSTGKEVSVGFESSLLGVI